jgi:AcrR family transcriptional regulator
MGEDATIAAGRPRASRAPDRRRAQLIGAALTLFESRPPNEVSVAQIAATAGLAKGTFYIYFASRDELLDALRAEFAEQAAQQLELVPLPTEAAAWPAFLDGLVDATIDIFLAHRTLHELLADAPHDHRSGPAEMPTVDRVVDRLQAMLAAGVAAGALRIGDKIAASLMLELLHAAGHLASEDAADVDRVRATTRELVRGALLL